MDRNRSRKIKDMAMTSLFCLAAFMLVAAIAGVGAFLFKEGWQILSLDFLIEAPRDGMTAGGIMTPLVGTIQLVIVSMAAALPIGIMTGLYFANIPKTTGSPGCSGYR